MAAEADVPAIRTPATAAKAIVRREKTPRKEGVRPTENPLNENNSKTNAESTSGTTANVSSPLILPVASVSSSKNRRIQKIVTRGPFAEETQTQRAVPIDQRQESVRSLTDLRKCAIFPTINHLLLPAQAGDRAWFIGRLQPVGPACRAGLCHRSPGRQTGPTKCYQPTTVSEPCRRSYIKRRRGPSWTRPSGRGIWPSSILDGFCAYNPRAAATVPSSRKPPAAAR